MNNDSAVFGLLMILIGIPWTIYVWRNIFRGTPEPPISNEAFAGALIAGSNTEDALRSAAWVGCLAPLLAPATVAIGFYLLFSPASP